MSILIYMVLGIVQGLTETIPVSSSGHLMIFKTLMNAKMDYDTLAIMTNFGSLVAIIILFRKIFMEAWVPIIGSFFFSI